MSRQHRRCPIVLLLFVVVFARIARFWTKKKFSGFSTGFSSWIKTSRRVTLTTGFLSAFCSDTLLKEKLRKVRFPYSQVAKCPELRENPFRWGPDKSQIWMNIWIHFFQEANLQDLLNRWHRQPWCLSLSFSKWAAILHHSKLFTLKLWGLYEFFLLFSSLSERAPRETKLHYAFKIYDFDQENIND